MLPMVQDMAMPSPGLGWRGRERASLEDRTRPDLVLFFAVVHHLVVGRNIPLEEVIDWLTGLGGRVVFEFVPPDDPMVEVLTANKKPHEIHQDYSEEGLRRHLEGRFAVDEELLLPGGQRRLFSLRPIGKR